MRAGRGAARERKWAKLFSGYEREHAELAGGIQAANERWRCRRLLARTDALMREIRGESRSVATRRASQLVLEALTPALPVLVGGSADLTGSNLTMVKGVEGGGKARWELRLLRVCGSSACAP
jgi:transketolase